MLLATNGKKRNGEALLLSLAYFACSGGEAELDRWHYVSGPGWVVGVDALAMGRAVLGLQSYPPPDVTGTSKLTAALGKRLDATAHEVDCGRYQELSAQRTRPTDEQIREMLAGTAPRRDQRDEASKEGDGYRQPTTEPIATIRVQALPTLRFQAANFDTPSGVNEIVLKQESGGTHTLLFEEPELRGFELAVDTQTPEDRGRVDLEPGTYTIYCRIPGHRAAGMEATITVT